jgi:hypothetical protein
MTPLNSFVEAAAVFSFGAVCLQPEIKAIGIAKAKKKIYFLMDEYLIMNNN